MKLFPVMIRWKYSQSIYKTHSVLIFISSYQTCTLFTLGYKKVNMFQHLTPVKPFHMYIILALMESINIVFIKTMVAEWTQCFLDYSTYQSADFHVFLRNFSHRSNHFIYLFKHQHKIIFLTLLSSCGSR